MFTASRISVGIRFSLLLFLQIPQLETCTVKGSPSLDLICPEVHVRTAESHQDSTQLCCGGDQGAKLDSGSNPSAQSFDSGHTQEHNSAYYQPSHHSTYGAPSPCSYGQPNSPPPCYSGNMQRSCCRWPCYQQPQCPAPSYCIQSVVVTGQCDVNDKNMNGNCGSKSNGGNTPGNCGNGTFTPINGGGGGYIDPISGGGGRLDPMTGGGGNIGFNYFQGSNGTGNCRNGICGESRYERYLDRLLDILEGSKKTRECGRSPLYVIPQTCSSPTIRVRKVCRKKKRSRCDPQIVIFEDDPVCPSRQQPGCASTSFITSRQPCSRSHCGCYHPCSYGC